MLNVGAAWPLHTIRLCIDLTAVRINMSIGARSYERRLHGKLIFDPSAAGCLICLTDGVVCPSRHVTRASHVGRMMAGAAMTTISLNLGVYECSLRLVQELPGGVR